MKLPRAKYNFGKSMAEMFSFSGLSHKEGARDGEIYDLCNIELDSLPCLGTRKRRQKLPFDFEGEIYGVGSSDKLFWCADDEFGEAYFYYDGEKMFPVEKSKKTFAVINKYICIFPDKKYFSLWEDEVKETYATLTELQKSTAELQESMLDNTLKDGDIYRVGTEKPYSIFQFNSEGVWKGVGRGDASGTEDYSVQSKWIYLLDSYGDMEGKYHFKDETDNGYIRCLKGSDDLMQIIRIRASYAKEINWMRDGDYFKIRIRTSHAGEEDTVVKWAKLTGKSTSEEDGKKYVKLYFDVEFTTKAIISITIERFVPQLEFAFCHENRLWGIEGDKIYASKLGDPFNGYDFSLTADGAWQVAVASSGPFTGGCVYNGYPTFFKEDSIIRVSGNYPSQYSTYETNDVAGVLKGSEKSLAIANGYLYYLSPEGVARYTGSYPSIVSDDLGKILSFGVAGAGADKYYLEAIDEEGEKAVYVFDTRYHGWTKEEPLETVGFTDTGRELYALGDGGIYLIDSKRELYDDSETVESFIEFAPIYEGSLVKKGLSKLLVNISVKDGSEVRIYLSYDGGEWILMKKWSTGGIHTVPLTIKRCGNYRIKISGEGEYKLLALSRERYLGSERG